MILVSRCIAVRALMRAQIIMDGCVALSRIIGQDRTGSELLPQCWEQISSKHKERRVLVAESCGALAPFVQSVRPAPTCVPHRCV
jgi:hypothetical protein